MREIPARSAAAAALALLIAGCGGAEEANEASAAPPSEALTLEQPGNDASALESAAGADGAPPLPANAADPPADAPGGAGETSGGDTGGNTLDANLSGL